MGSEQRLGKHLTNNTGQRREENKKETQDKTKKEIHTNETCRAGSRAA